MISFIRKEFEFCHFRFCSLRFYSLADKEQRLSYNKNKSHQEDSTLISSEHCILIQMTLLGEQNLFFLLILPLLCLLLFLYETPPYTTAGKALLIFFLCKTSKHH